MRLKKEDKILAFDGTGRVYQGRILDTTDKKVCIQIERMLEEQQASNLEITLAQALPKGNKMDYIVEKATELGVDTIIPVVTSRTIVKLDQARFTRRRMRWARLVLAAAKQCGRRTIPQLKTLTPWPKLLSCLDDFDLKLLFSLSEKAENLKDVLRLQKKVKKIALFIGPEGDFTAEEIRMARDAGSLVVSLGKNVLKSDTACISALAMINYELG